MQSPIQSIGAGDAVVNRPRPVSCFACGMGAMLENAMT